jgi:hypothetical protein
MLTFAARMNNRTLAEEQQLLCPASSRQALNIADLKHSMVADCGSGI